MKTQVLESTVRGMPICRGIAIGKPFLFTVNVENSPEYLIPSAEIELEVTRFQEALSRSLNDVSSLQKQLEKENAVEGAAILEAQFLMMQDPLMTTHVAKGIRDSHMNAEHVFKKLIDEYQQKFSALPTSFFRERFKDLQDITRRIMNYLRKAERNSLAHAPRGSIVFAKELAASDAAEAKRGCVSGFVTEVGGITSHAAIVSKAKGISYVTNVLFDAFDFDNIDLIILDGRTGEIILNPSEETVEIYKNLQNKLQIHFEKLEAVGGLEAETFDGYKVKLTANIELGSEVELLHQYGGHGVGLFRSEYIFLTKNSFPTEEEQFIIYRQMVERMCGLPIVIRTFDVGGDKFTITPANAPESNPFLGCRAIRYMLKEKHIFNTQLRAILRASVYGDVSIMFPMISGLPELLEAKQMIKEAQAQLALCGIETAPHIRIGCMIEVPSAAIISDLLAKECDFLSIGTNDLVQYCLAVDRGNQAMSKLYAPTHPSVIRLIKFVVNEANQFGIPVTVCGEIAADPRFTTLLLGLGVHELSVAARYIPLVKNAIRHASMVDAMVLAEKCLSLGTAEEIQDLLTQEYKKIVPDDFFFNFL